MNVIRVAQLKYEPKKLPDKILFLIIEGAAPLYTLPEVLLLGLGDAVEMF